MVREASFDCRAQGTFRRTVRLGYWVESDRRLIVRNQAAIELRIYCGPGHGGKLGKKGPVHAISQIIDRACGQGRFLLHRAIFVRVLTIVGKLG